MAISFGKISQIQVTDISTWKDKVFLTFDIDWASDDVLAYTIDILESADVEATWFVTHHTPLLARLRDNPKFELGIHPNFNFLLTGDPRNGRDADEVVGRLLEVVPEAKAVRSHSMTQSTNIQKLFAKMGLSHDCNHFVPEQASIELKPWNCWNGLVKVPYFWEDDVACIYPRNRPVTELAQRSGIKVFDFHPIHIFLNTEDLKRYNDCRSIHHDSNALIAHRNATEGACTALQSLLRF